MVPKAQETISSVQNKFNIKFLTDHHRDRPGTSLYMLKCVQNIVGGYIKMTEKRETCGAWKDDECIVTDMSQDLRLRKGRDVPGHIRPVWQTGRELVGESCLG